MIQTKWLTFFVGLYENEDQSNALDKIRGRESNFKPWPGDYIDSGSWTTEDL